MDKSTNRQNTQPPTLEVVVPVYNEQASLERSIRTLHEYLAAEIEVPWQITIADNASTDATLELATFLTYDLDRVAVLHLDDRGRGRALKRAWLESNARVVAYLDVDLSTDLRGLPPLIAPLLSGHSDVAIGTRLAASARVTRAGKREFISRSYNFLLRRLMGAQFSDAQCGFKAMRTDVAAKLLPLVEDTGWFFDTELLILAERSGMRIHEVPVDWVDDPDSRVDLVSTAKADLAGMWRVTRGLVSGRIPVDRVYAELGRHPFAVERPPSFFGQVVRFGVVGVLSTAAYALLYLLFSSVMIGFLANFLALLVTAIANTAANRRFTFGVRGRSRLATHQFQGLIVFGIAWLITSGALLELHAINPGANSTVELIVLTFANLLATVLRFVLFRAWVFRSRPAPLAAADFAPRETFSRDSLQATIPSNSQTVSAS
ncbi:MAG TPA: bifunctional glycosyltransferase family 2/GtrA family protein [Galbitalea sp.]|jgi:putative flippase GtrA|nr:bifunctional glycosyltransferase family 2/GtrA family protein [Galbitalea sp.]